MLLSRHFTLVGLLLGSLLLFFNPTAAQTPPVTITLWHIATESDPFRPVLQSTLDAFNAQHTEVQFEAIAIQNEVFKDQLHAAVLTGQQPDVFQTWGGGLLEAYAKAGLVREIPELPPPLFLPIALAPTTFDGKHYAVPANLAGVFLWYNRDLFYQHQIDLPLTWDGLLAACRSFQQAGILPVAVGNHGGWPGGLWMSYLVARLKGSGDFDETTLVQAGEHLQEAVRAGCFGTDVQANTYGEAQALFANGGAAMQLQGDWNLGGLRAVNSAVTGSSIRVLPFPIMTDQGANRVLGGTGQAFAVSSSAPPQTAPALIQLLGSDAFGKAVAEANFIPALTGYDVLILDPLVREMATLLNSAAEIQSYLDQDLPPGAAKVHLQTTQQLLSSSITPADAAAQVWAATFQEQTIRAQAPLSLKQLGEIQNIQMGTAVLAEPLRTQPLYADVVKREFNVVTPETSMKWFFLRPTRDSYNFTDADFIVNFARANGMAVRGHPLVWHLQIPPWLEQGVFTRDELIQILRDHILTVVGRYRGQVAVWDVVNEAVADDGSLRDNLWLRAIGPEYIDYAFQWAHEADPTARLFYNDYDSEGLNPKSDAVYQLLSTLKARGVPIDGVGLQMHVSLNEPPVPEAVLANMQRLSALGLEIHITEMDVQTWDSNLSLPDKLAQQARIYGEMAGVCVQIDACTAFITWGFTDQYTWITDPAGAKDITLLFDSQYQPKLAYFSLVAALDTSGW